MKRSEPQKHLLTQILVEIVHRNGVQRYTWQEGHINFTTALTRSTAAFRCCCSSSVGATNSQKSTISAQSHLHQGLCGEQTPC
jgi:hypothetical protein